MKNSVAILTNNNNCEKNIQYYSIFDVDFIIISSWFHNMIVVKSKNALNQLKTMNFKGKIILTGYTTIYTRKRLILLT
jgi:hypothetical protein